MCMNRELDGTYVRTLPLNFWVDINSTGGSPDAVVVSHSHSITDPGHSHILDSSPWDGNQGAPKVQLANWSAANRWTTDSKKTGITGTNSEGVDGTNKNLPQYYALAYIMRIS